MKKNVRGYYNCSVSVNKIPDSYLYGKEKKFPFEITLHEKGSASRLYLSKTGLQKLTKVLESQLK